MRISEWVVSKNRVFRTKYLTPLAGLLANCGVSADLMTLISLLTGIAAVYFLLENQLMFVILAIIHLVADGLDGVIARVTKSTKFGAYFDYATDRMIAFLVLIKVGFVLNDFYPYMIAGLFLLHNLIYVISKKRAPIMFGRTLILIILMFNLPIVAYLTFGVFMVYGLALQLRWKFTI